MPVEIRTPPSGSDLSARPTLPAMKRGALNRCPHCGNGGLFRGYLKVRDACETCGEELHHQRADDAPPYFTIVIVGHIVIPLVLLVEETWQPAIWLQMLFWIPLTLALTILLLRPIKGATVGLQWAQRMHGFDPTNREGPEVRPGVGGTG